MQFYNAKGGTERSRFYVAHATLVTTPSFYATLSPGSDGPDTFAMSTSISNDGNTIVLGDPYSYPTGWAGVYKYNNGGWALSAELALSYTGVTWGGWNVSISGDGKTILMTDTLYQVWPGIAIIYNLSANGISWLGPTLLTPPADTNNFGSFAELSGDGKTVIASGQTSVQIYTLSTDGLTWNGPVYLPGGNVAYGGVGLSDDGKTALACNINGRYAGIFNLVGGTWSLTASLTPMSETQLGTQASLSGDGKTAIVSSQTLVGVYNCLSGSWSGPVLLSGIITSEFWIALRLTSDGKTALVGSLYYGVVIYKLVNGVWSTPTKFTPPPIADNIYFGAPSTMTRDGSIAVVTDWSAIGKPVMVYKITTTALSDNIKMWNH
jgi:hypothetical protein